VDGFYEWKKVLGGKIPIPSGRQTILRSYLPASGKAGKILAWKSRLARYAQFYSRIGFVHEFRPLSATEMRSLLTKRWSPLGITPPDMDPEAVRESLVIGQAQYHPEWLSQKPPFLPHLFLVTRTGFGEL
jgi:hypothetical protein